MPEQSDFLKSLNLGGGTTAPPNTPVSGGNLFSSKTAEGSSASSSDFLRSLSSPSESSQASSPVNGQTSAQAPSSSDQPWYSRAWDWANTPLLDASVFGLPEDLGMGGFGRGVEHVVSGLTSPLSIALGAATFGTGGFIAGAGETALKESGEFTAAQIADAISASKIALKTAKSMPDIEPVISGALKAGGHDLDLLERARALTFPVNRDAELASEELQKNLSEVGLSEAQRTALKEGTLSEAERSAIATANTKIPGFSTEELKALSDTGDTVAKAKDGFRPLDDAVRDAGYDVNNWKKATAVLSDKKLDVTKDLLGGNLLQRGAFQILHKAAPDVSFGALTKAADTANTVMNWGFTYQQLETAAQMSPRFFDALKEGDADHAWEYGTELFASGAMGALGAPHALHSAGELFRPLLGSTDVPKLSDRWLAIESPNKDREAAHAVAEQDAVNKYNTAFDLLGLKKPHPVLGLSKEDKAFNVSRIAEVQARIETETDPEKARILHNILVEAQGGGEYQPIPTPLGTPLADNEAPPRAGTRVATDADGKPLSNDAGEVRESADGKNPVVFMSPEAWSELSTHIGNPGTGQSFSFSEIDRLLHPTEEDLDAGRVGLHPDSPAAQLLEMALQKSHLVAVSKTPGYNPNFTVKVVAEELQHTWDRELSQTGEIKDFFDAPQWSRLRGILPAEQVNYLNELEYTDTPVNFVAETAAKFRAGIIPEAVSDEDAARWLNEFYKEVEAKHGPQSLSEANRINEIARQHVEDIYAARENRTANAPTGQGVVGGVQEGSRGATGLGQAKPAEGKTGLASRVRELDEEPLSFASPNVHNLGGIDEAQQRLESRPQKIAEKLSGNLAEALKLKSSVRPALGHWEGGAKNSVLHRFAPGTDPDAVEYHNTLVAKAGYQNAGAGFIPGEGKDVLFQFRVAEATASAKQISEVLEQHGIPEDTIEPTPGGNTVHVVSPNGELRPQVSEIAARLGAEKVGEIYGRKFENGDYADRDAAQSAFDRRITELEAKHPEWSGVRQAFESRPDHVELRRLVRETQSPFIEVTHGSSTPGLDEVKPEFFGKGPQGGAEQARARDFPEDFPKRSYFQITGTRGEPFYTHQAYQYKARFNAENLYNLVEDPDGLLAKAQEEAVARKMPTPAAIWTIYERMIKDAGYDGGFKPDGTVMAFKDTPVEAKLKADASGRPLSGLASREKPAEWDDIKPHLTPEEVQKHDTPEKQNLLTAAFNSMPDHEEWTAAIRAGKAGQLWYERSTRAFDALIDSGIPWLWKADKEKFLNFTAALSPVQPVQANLRMALNLWAKWDKAGRPQDVTWKDGKVASKNASLYRVLAGRGEAQGVDLPARMGNAIRALQGEPLSGPKVSSFTKNLGKDSSRVTNDTWMAVFGDHDPNRINKPAVYDAMSAKVREAAKAEGVEPRQAQAAIWCFIKSLAELSGWGNDRWIPPQEIIKQGLLTPELVAQHSADFADMLKNDPEIRGVIKKLGGDLNALDTKLETYVPRKPVTGEAQEPATHLLNAANRLEAARRDSRIASHLARKSGPSLFDTEFGPGNGLFSKQPETMEEMGLSLVDKASVPGYELELVTAKDDPSWFELGFQQEGKDSSSVTQQSQKFPSKSIPFQQIKPVLDSWLEKHPKIHVMSFNQDYLNKYVRILKKAGYNVGKEPELVEGKEAYYISRPENGLFAKEKENRAPVWYLKSTQLVDSRMQGPMPADTVLKMLENNGVKPDELKYTGLSDFLREKGKEPVRPEEVRQYLAANNLQIQEATKGGGNLEGVGNWQQRLDYLNRDIREIEREYPDQKPTDYADMVRERDAVRQQVLEGVEKPTKFGTYTLPGGQNYREMLLTLPKKEGVERPFEIKYDPDARANENWVILKNGMRQGYASSSADANAMADHLFGEGWRQKNPVQPENFQSGHWDEPNVVGHVRFNDRVGPNGEKLLHLEELQSDWHQKGRTQGYNLDPARIESLRKEASDLRERLKDPVTDEELANYFKPGNIVNSYGGKDKVISFHPGDPNGTGWNRVWSVKVRAIDPKTGELDPREYDRTHSTRPDAKDVHPEIQDRLNEISKETVHSGVPDAPFKKTDEWTGLFFKRMIRYAAENGYDGISWTPGVEHFNRWGSERFDWEKTEDGKWTVAGTDQHGGNAGGVDLEGEATRRGLLNKSGGQVKSQADLRAIVHRVMHIAGREKVDAVTKKLWDRMQTEPTGTSMPRKEGFESYYDQITPQVANKLGKQFGAKVGETKIEVSDGSKTRIYEGPTLSTADLDKIASEAEGTQLEGQARAVAYEVRYSRIPFAEAVRDFGSEAYAEKIGGKLNIQKEVKTSAVPYFPITDSMRESVLKQGQPLFSRERPDNGYLPDNLDDMIRNNVFKDKPKEYRDLVMSTYRNAATTAPDPQMKAAMDFIRNEHDRSFEIGSANDILQHYIDDYFQRTWDNSNPVGRVISADAKSGKFATNVTMARRRVYNSTLEGLLKSPKQLKFDIVNNMARGRAEIIKAAANRQFIRSLRDDFSRGSDGRPAVFLAGSGNVVTGQNGEDPKTFISPDRVQKVSIAQSNIDEMKKTGDFDRFLADGTIKDITPRVHPDNIGMAIDRLEKQALSKNAQYDEVGNNKLRTDLMYLKSMLANKDYSGLREFNDAQKPVYAWDPQDYVTLDHNAMRGWNFVTNDSAGHGILVDADIKAHPEFAQYLKNRLGLEESGIAKNPVGKALLGAGSAAKHVLLSLSPFHMVQIGLRGVMTGVNPFTLHGPDLLDGAKIDPSDPHSETKLMAMVRQGYTTGTDFRGQQQMSEGLSTGGDALRRIPGIGNTLANSMNWYQDFLFKRYIPAMKATAGEHLFDQYRASHPEWSNDRVAKAAALHANESFGGINWRAMGRSTTTQDWGRLMLLAPDWLESEMRSGARLFNREEGNIGRKQVVMMTLGMWGIARVLNTLSTGSPHLEAPFGLAVKNKEGKEIIFGMRTLPTDLLHAATDPVGFIKGRLSPTIHAGQELLTQRDSFGRKLGPEDLWADVFHNMMPIPGQAIGQAITSTGPQVGTLGQVWKAGGGTAQVYATPAQKMAAELAANHNEDGPIDRAQMDRHRRIMDLEDSVRSGETSWPELVKLAYNTDQLKESELKKIQLNLTKTKGMDSTMASLYTRASRLPAAEFFKLFDTMNNSEKTALIPLTQQVMKRYTAKAMKDMTPSERAKDPTLQRILNMMHPSGQPPPSQEQ